MLSIRKAIRSRFGNKILTGSHEQFPSIALYTNYPFSQNIAIPKKLENAGGGNPFLVTL